MRWPESFLTGASWGGLLLVQVTLVALVGLLAWLLLRRGGPALRGAVLLAALVGLLLLPALAGLAPTWLPLPECLCPSNPTHAATADPGRTHAPSFGAEVDFSVKVALPADKLNPDGTLKAENANPLVDEAEAMIDLKVIAEELPPAETVVEQPRSTWSLAAVLLVCWLLGSLVCVVRSLKQLLALYRSSWQAKPVLDQDWVDCMLTEARRIGCTPVVLKECPAITSPLTLGLFRPVILLPLGRDNWSTTVRALILGHELAHVHRRDFLAGLLVELVKCLFWFHPLVLWLSARLHLEQEYAADAWVASAHDSHDYIRALARLALEQEQGRRSVAPALWRRRPEILRRIDMLQRNPKGVPWRLSRRTTALVVVFTAVVALVVAGVGPLNSAAPTPAEKESARPVADAQGDLLPAGTLARLGTTRLRHAGEVTFVAFVADGKLLTAGKDNTVRLWDLETHKEIRRFGRPAAVPREPKKEEKGKPVRGGIEMFLGAQRGGGFQIAVTADGKKLAVAGSNGVQLHEISTGKELCRTEGPENGVVGLIFSPDGRTLAGRGGDGSLYLWSTETGKQIHHIKPAPRPKQNGVTLAFGAGGGHSPAPGLTFTHDSKTLVAAATDYQKDEPIRSVKFFDVASGKETRKIEAPKGLRVWSMAVSRAGRLLAYGAARVVHIRDLITDKEVHQFEATDGIHFLAFSTDGKTLAVRGLNERIRLWDTSSGKELRQLNDAELTPRGNGLVLFSNDDRGRSEVRALAFSPNSKRIASAAGTTVRVWDTATGNEVSLVESHWRAPSAIVVSADGRTVATWGADRVVRRWDAVTGKALGSFPAPAKTTLATFHPDGRTVALANEDRTIGFYDIVTGKRRSQLKSGHGNGIAAMAFAPGGKVLATRGYGDNSIRLHDLTRGVEVGQLIIRPKNPQPQGRVLILGGGGRQSSGTGPGLAFSPDGKLVAVPVGGTDRSNTILFFDSTSGKELRRIESAQPMASFAFSPDSRSLAAENVDGTVTLHEVASGKVRGQLGTPAAKPPQQGGGGFAVAIDGVDFGGSNEPGGPVGVSFSPDGRAVVVRGRDRSVRVWDLKAGKEIEQLKGHSGAVRTVAFAGNGKTIASGSTDTTVLLWDAPRSLKDLAKPRTLTLTAEEVESAWATLAGEDAVKARQSVSRLVAGAQQSLPFLSKQLKPATRIDPKKISGWLADLESEKYSVRREATSGLVKAGEQAVPALKKLLASGPPLETRKRVEELVDRLTNGTLTTEQLRVVRAVEALEQIATPEARRLLQTLAEGAPGALSTREAESALHRLAGKRN